MQKKHEGEDKAKRELIDSQNQAEQLIYQTEKNIEEHKEKIQKDDMKNLNNALEDLKKNKDSSNLESLKSSLDNLNKAWSEVASKMYDASKSEEKNEDSPKNNTNAKSKTKKKKEDEIEDADFEVVD